MNIGCGIDLVETKRFSRRKGHFLNRLFTLSERAYCAKQPDPAPHYAARFAAKEAVLKALGTGWSGGIAWTDVEVTRSPKGNPGILLKGKAAAFAKKMGVKRWHLSIAHTAIHGTAIAIAEGD